MKQYLALAVLFCAIFADAQNVNFSEHIAPIIYNHCTTCHRPGEVGPFPLTNYSEVSAYANTIQLVTQTGYMPPWKPDPNYQRYQNENFLSEEQKQLINDWVNQGSPQGNPALEPPLPVFPTGSQVGVPDLVLSFAESFTQPGNNLDTYRYFVIPTGLTQDRNIKSVEFRPGNPRIVHHALIWEDTTGEAMAADLATPEYGYAEGAGSTNLSQMQLPGYVPGAAPVVYSNGITQKLHAGSDLKVQVHYAPTSVEETDSSSINIFFENGAADRILQGTILVPLPGIIQNGPFVIPANQTREFHGLITVPFDASLYSVAPHSHLLGTHWKVFAIKPDGDTIPIVWVRDWDFNWQGSYQFKQLIKIPAGSTIHAYAGYDNTANNIYNPNNPPQLVTWGEGTADEMYYLPLGYLFYQPGDENIVFEDQTVSIPHLAGTQDKLYPISPSPSNGLVKLSFTLSEKSAVTVRILDVRGNLVETIQNQQLHQPGYHTRDCDLSHLAAGLYFVEWSSGQKRQTEKLIIAR